MVNNNWGLVNTLRIKIKEIRKMHNFIDLKCKFLSLINTSRYRIEIENKVVTTDAQGKSVFKLIYSGELTAQVILNRQADLMEINRFRIKKNMQPVTVNNIAVKIRKTNM